MELKEWMGLALQKAEDSLRAGEVPVGCLFIYENEVIASGNNTVNETRNATRHAEINCIDKVLEYCKERNLDYHDVFKQIDVVVTVEPCIMCAAALHQLHIRSIVYGCPNDRFGGCASVFEVPKIADATIDITSNVRAAEAMILLKNFYKGTNPNAPECKAKKKKRDQNAQLAAKESSEATDNKEENTDNVDNDQKNSTAVDIKDHNETNNKVNNQNEDVALKNEQNIEKSEIKIEMQKEEKNKINEEQQHLEVIKEPMDNVNQEQNISLTS